MWPQKGTPGAPISRGFYQMRQFVGSFGLGGFGDGDAAAIGPTVNSLKSSTPLC